MKPTELPTAIGGAIAKVVIGAGLAVGFTLLYLTVWGLGHMKNPTYHGRKMS